jgi:hypothetical protein
LSSVVIEKMKKGVVYFLILSVIYACNKSQDTTPIVPKIDLEWNLPLSQDTFSSTESIHVDGMLSSNIVLNGFKLFIKSTENDSILFQNQNNLQASYYILHEHTLISVSDTMPTLIEIQVFDTEGKLQIFQRNITLTP